MRHSIKRENDHGQTSGGLLHFKRIGELRVAGCSECGFDGRA
jgi:hypothetical protein